MEKISVYTDGSCNTAYRTGAWAAILLKGKEKSILKGHENNTTHQRMELSAVINALLYIHKNDLASFEIILYTDSQYIAGLPARKEKLQAVAYVTKKNTPLPNADLLEMLYRMSNPLNIRFVKVKGHQKQSGETDFNREADMICRKMMREVSARQSPAL